MEENPSCNRAGKLFRGCKWQILYDTKTPSEELRLQITKSWELPLWLAEMGIEEEKYVGAICTTCGKTANRNGKKSNEIENVAKEKE
jgi:hypothetical protein